MENKGVKLVVTYPYAENAHFDFEYYVNRHVKMIEELLGSALKGCEIEKGLFGATPKEKPQYIARCCMHFESTEVMGSALSQHGKQIQSDVPNYTTIKPLMQVSEIL